MQKILLALVALISFKSYNMETLESLKLYHSDQVGFLVQEEDSALVSIHNYDIDPVLRGKNSALLKAFYEKGGRTSLHKLDNGDFVLRAHVPGFGAGPGLGQIFGWTVRGVGYGGYTVACFFHPELLIEAEVAHATIESTALAATVAGTALPWF